MNTKLLRYKAWLSVLRDVSKEYHGRNIDNIIQNIESVIKELEKQKEEQQ